MLFETGQRLLGAALQFLQLDRLAPVPLAGDFFFAALLRRQLLAQALFQGLRFLDTPVQLAEESRHIPLAVAQRHPRAAHDVFRHAEPGRDFQARRLPWQPQLQKKRRLESIFVESHRPVDHALRRCAIDLERHQVRGDQRERAGRAEMVHNRHAQRAAFLRIGRRAQLIEQHQRAGRHVERHFPNVRYVRRKRAEVFLNRLVIADIGQHLFEDREFGFRRRHRQRGLRHQAEQPHGLERHRFAAGVGAADEQRAALALEIERDRNGLALAPPEHVFEQRMARLAQQQPLAEARDGAIEFDRKARLGEDQIQLRHHDQRLADGIGVAAQAVRHLEQDAMHFSRFLFAQPHQFVVEVDCFERLDEQRMAARTGAVDHPVQFAPLPGDHRHHETLIADGDELFLEDAFLAVRLQEAFERFLNRLFLPLRVAAQARQRHTGVIGHRAIGQDLAFQVL